MEASDVSGEPRLAALTLFICELCLDGRGGECHAPGCVFWMHTAPTAEQAEAMRAHGIATGDPA